MRNRKHLMHVFCTLALMVVHASFHPSLAQAADFEWAVATGTWNVATNWDRGTVPTSNDTPTIDNDGTCKLDDDRQVLHLTVGDSYSTSTSVLEHSVGTFTVHGTLTVARSFNSQGGYDFTGGKLVVFGPGYIGGRFRVDSTGAKGSFTNSGGLHIQKEFLAISEGDLGCGGTGRYTLTHEQSRLVVEDHIWVGCFRYGSGVLDIQNGEVTTQTELYIGGVWGSSGTVRIDNAASLAVDRDLWLGGYSWPSGDGTLEIASADAAVKIGGSLYVWESAVLRVSGTAGATITMAGPVSTLTILSGATSANLSGLGGLRLIFEGEDGSGPEQKWMELAGADEGILGDFDEENFVLDELVVGKPGGTATHGPVTLYPRDWWNNQDPYNPGPEALYVRTLTMEPGGTFWPQTPDKGLLPIYYQNGGGGKRLYMGDANLDGQVDVFDLAILANHYGLSGMTWNEADFNGDRIVNIYDMAILANWYGSGPGGGMAMMGPPLLDYDEDGRVGILDVYILLSLVAEAGGP